ncbi:50S ribosomal protein L25/general stress protein Ctc [Aneurinibacillus tyrosinisolvens]|uniref:50S ribosomal protein L25/general stress protein Ctc n=1 Tax=Aneurinibacillus tyrosinisolvens TaxID=1443435 RepID=UPI00063F397E|nr:50S ribosomal protein L25/general stress protein Ctc [Aneurinibacillus tyrosinisolvens]
MAIVLKAQKRGAGKHSVVRQLRIEGKIPAVIYGSDVESQPISIEESQFMQVVRQQGINHVVRLAVDGTEHNVMIKDIQREPLKGRTLHIDFGKVNMNEEIDTIVPLTIEGEAEGVKAGGVLEQQLRELSIRCLPGAIPDSISVSVEKLAVGDSLTVGDLDIPADVTVQHEESDVVLSIVPPRIEPVDEGTEGDAAGDAEASRTGEAAADES